MNRKQTGWWMIGGGILAIVGGLFLPWATLTAPLVGSISVYGSQGDGWIVAGAAVLGLIAGMGVMNGRSDLTVKILASLAVIGVGLVAVNDFPAIAQNASDSDLGQVGTGVYAVVAGGIGMLVGTTVSDRFGSLPTMPLARITVTSVSDEGDQVVVWGDPEYGDGQVGFVFVTRGPDGSVGLAERASRLAPGSTVLIEYTPTAEGWNLASGLSA